MIKISILAEGQIREMYVPAIPHKGDIFRFEESSTTEYVVDSVRFVGDGELSFEARIELLPA